MGLNLKDIKIDKNIPVPLYYQIKQAIHDKIVNGELKADECMPTELEFVSSLNISRSTIRQALNELVNEGLICREKGRGTFISKPKIEEGFFQRLHSFNDEMIKKGMTPSTEVLDLKVIPGITSVNSQLNLSDDEQLIYLSRLRFANDEPVVYVETYLPYEKYKDLATCDFAKHSLYTLLEENFGERVLKAVRKIEAVNSRPSEAKLLKIKQNDAICLVKSTAYTAGNIPVEYSIARYRGDRNQFTVELHR